MKKIRLIPRLDVKGPNLIKGIHLEGLRVIGNPQEFATWYYNQGADELIYMDIVASLYGRNNLVDIVQRTAQHVFIPMTVGGGIRSTEDVKTILRAGADKVAINTAAINRPELITEVARQFGSQCMVLSIAAQRVRKGFWEAYTDNGRERTGKDVVEWAIRGLELGAGEILLTSMDKDGTKEGFDLELLKKASKELSIPVIASGGVGKLKHFKDGAILGKANALLAASVFHFGEVSIQEVKDYLIEAGINVRID